MVNNDLFTRIKETIYRLTIDEIKDGVFTSGDSGFNYNHPLHTYVLSIQSSSPSLFNISDVDNIRKHLFASGNQEALRGMTKIATNFKTWYMLESANKTVPKWDEMIDILSKSIPITSDNDAAYCWYTKYIKDNPRAMGTAIKSNQLKQMLTNNSILVTIYLLMMTANVSADSKIVKLVSRTTSQGGDTDVE